MTGGGACMEGIVETALAADWTRQFIFEDLEWYWTVTMETERICARAYASPSALPQPRFKATDANRILLPITICVVPRIYHKIRTQTSSDSSEL